MQITHKIRDGHYMQIVSPEVLREILDDDGSTYARPTDFGEDDEWDVGEDDEWDVDEDEDEE